MFESLHQAKENAKRMAVAYVIWAETELKGKTGAEKKAAVIKKLDDMITLPGWLEWLDDILIGLFIDKVCLVLNLLTGHDFAGLQLLDTKQTDVIVETADNNPNAASAAKGDTVSDKIANLAVKVGVDLVNKAVK